METSTKRYLAAAALLGGGVTLGAIVSPIGLAGAQGGDDTDDTTSDEGTDSSETESNNTDGERRGGPGHRGGKTEALTEILGLTADELRAELAEGKTVAEIAEEQGIATDDLVAQLVASAEERLDEAVADERIDAEAAEERLADAEERISEFVTTDPSELQRRGGHGRGHHHRRGFGPGRFGADFDDIAETLGLDTAEVRAGFADDKSLAEIAAEQGVSEDELVSALVAAAMEEIDEAVEAERIDTERADELKAMLDERVSQLVNTTPGERGGRGHSHFHRHGPRAGAGAGADGETVESAYTA